MFPYLVSGFRRFRNPVTRRGGENVLRPVKNRQFPKQNGPFLRVLVGGVTTGFFRMCVILWAILRHSHIKT